ncbi:hypothetical protein SynWH8101_1879 [Synechococcus sp. WH 8101]|uniref:YcjF family protein n=1 Tax=Synechococcus sp. WH 8101 TaxID=59932 RepID=UPI0010236CF4|nr:YcjF family protein [Synechococcus sp. WH 8101]QBE69461.1 hypothetical protein SynWH8101_1879 [Synechococcus sp. WH 8101]QNI45713.1 uncharacterized conserved membrane protein (DUF697) [Synechococcus sp. WH 8101]
MLPVPSLGSLNWLPVKGQTLLWAGGSLLFGQWVCADVLHLPGGGLGVLVVGAGVWWLSRPAAAARFQAPTTLPGWVQRCRDVLDQFDRLEEPLEESGAREERQRQLDALLERSGPLAMAVVASAGVAFPERQQLEQALAGPSPLQLSLAHPLTTNTGSWTLPDALEHQDALLFLLPLPLRAADFLRLEQIADDQPAWLLVERNVGAEADLCAQLPERWHDRLLIWDGTPTALRPLLQPLRRLLQQPQRSLDATRQRLLARLHQRWQAELEQRRRERFRNLLQRSQWLVAGAVVVSPLPSGDLVAVAVGNGLMLREMAQVWDCPWTSEVLQVAARHLGAAALAQGVVEWSGQALLGFAKLDGGSWLAAGALQALSAAYLTRVVGASMADWMALNAGVAEPDLALLKQQAPLLVAQAAERERLDWNGFLQQAREWTSAQTSNLRIKSS